MMFLFDFLVFYAAGKSVLAGQSPYGSGFISPYPLAVVFAPAALLPVPLAYGGYLAFCLFLLWRLMRQRAIWALLSFPVLFSLYVGQIDLPLALGISAAPWLLPLAMVKPQVGVVVAPWLLRRYTRRDWARAIVLGLGLLGLSFALRPGWVSEWMSAQPSVAQYSQHTSNLFFLLPKALRGVQWVILPAAVLSAVAAFFLKSQPSAWSVSHLFAPLSNIYSASVLALWIGPLEMAASYLAVGLTGGEIHEGMPMFLVGLVILARQVSRETARKSKQSPPTRESLETGSE